MGLEAGTFISDLVDTNPIGGDPKAQGDDHIRLLKQTLKGTFPNLNGAVNATPAQLNAAIAPGALCFPGMIVMWSGTLLSVPAGWVLCNGSGTLSNGNPVPDLRDKFIVGAGSTYAVGAKGGSLTSPLTGSTSVGGGATINIPNTGWGIIGSGLGAVEQGRVVVGSGSAELNEILESLRGSNAGPSVVVPNHSHTISGSVNVLPPYFALAYLIKT